MKSLISLFIKMMLFTYILSLTPFFEVFPEYLGINPEQLSHVIYKYDRQEETNTIKERLNLINISEAVMLSDEMDQPFVVSKNTYVEGDQKQINKKVYIFNTHQQEEYIGGKSVVDASIQLANQLQNAGIQVVYESNDFQKWLNEKGLDYNYSYHASNYFLNEAIVKYGGFDLIIDFHRDAVPRDSSFVVVDDVKYAKMMFVIGGLSKNVKEIKKLSAYLTNQINEMKPSIMKIPMIREAYYNQDVFEKMVLIEVGSDHNTYQEVVDSTKLLGKAIIKYLQR